MREKDLTEKILERHNDVFADIINGVVFGGKSVIKEDELEDTALESAYRSLSDGEIHSIERDVAKIWKTKGIKIALFGLENQTRTDKYMPLRIMSYEGASYRSMLNEKKSEIYPVISIVLYFGEKPWRGPVSAVQLLKDLGRLPDEFVPFVNDCKIHVVPVRLLEKEEINRFHNDFKEVVNSLSLKYKDNEIEKNVNHPYEVYNLVNAVAGDRKIKEDKRMQDLAKRIRDEGIEEGKAEGKEKGKLELALKVLKGGKYSVEEISDMTGFSVDFLKEQMKKDA